MKACTLGFGSGRFRNWFNKDKRGRDRPRGSQRAAPARGKYRLIASKGNGDRAHYTKAEMRHLPANEKRY